MKRRLLSSLVVFIFIIILFLYFKKSSKYIDEKYLEFKPVSFTKEEEEFPLAYGISVYRDGEQFLELLAVIYRPFNVYCVHVDGKSEEYIHKLVSMLIRKYENIIVPKKFINVYHSKFSVLESELLCMEALYEYRRIVWKYFINLTGQELPLKTNLELVRILRILKGGNLMEKIRVNSDRIPAGIGPPPHGLHLWKGAVHILVVRDFVRFALYDKHALDLLNYLRRTFVPDETYFSTLNHNVQLRVPGGFRGNVTTHPILYPYINRYKIWDGEGHCHGKFIRYICIFSMEDVPAIISPDNKKLFVNKFVIGVNDNVWQHIVNWFKTRSRVVYSQTSRNPFINLTYYSQMSIVNNHFV